MGSGEWQQQKAPEQTYFAPDSDIEEEQPKKATKANKRKTDPVGMEKTPEQKRVINQVSEWVRDVGIKPKSKYI